MRMKLLVLNPIVFPLLALMLPRKISELMGNKRVWWALVGWQICILPWRAKWWFVHQNPQYFSQDDWVKYYRKAADGAGALRHLRHCDTDICEKLWNTCGYHDAKNILKSLRLYETEHLKFMLVNKEFNGWLWEYTQRMVLPTDFVKSLISEISGKNDKDDIRWKIIKLQIDRNDELRKTLSKEELKKFA